MPLTPWGLSARAAAAAESLKAMGIHYVHELLSAAESSSHRPQLKQLLRKDLDRVLEQARTSLPLPNRIWRRADDHSARAPPCNFESA